MPEPSLTWNLFLTAILFPVLYKMIERLLSKRDKERDAKDARIERLLLEKDTEKEANIKERWARFNDTLCGIKNKVDAISVDLNTKVTWEHCEKTHEKLDDRIRERA